MKTAPAVSVVFEAAPISRAITRIAHEILEANKGAQGLVLLGIPTRGVWLAQRLAALISQFEGGQVACGVIDPTPFRDDLGPDHPPIRDQTQIPTTGVDDRVVVLVDDVLYSGRTVRAALNAVSEIGRPRAVRLAVLVDRGHREIPIRADHVGKNLPTSQAERVAVLLAEEDGCDEVRITRPSGSLVADS